MMYYKPHETMVHPSHSPKINPIQTGTDCNFPCTKIKVCLIFFFLFTNSIKRNCFPLSRKQSRSTSGPHIIQGYH